MKKTFPLLVALLFLTVLYAGCTEKAPAIAGTQEAQGADSGGTASPEAAPWEGEQLQALFQKTDGGSRETVVLLSNKTRTASAYFLSDTANFLVLRRYAANRQIIRSDTLVTNEYTYTSIDSQRLQTAVINGAEFLFLTVRESFMGQAVTETSVNFKMADLRTFKVYSLNYTGTESVRSNGRIDGVFGEGKALSQTPDMRDKLYQYARKSDWIYVPSGTDLDGSNYKNYVQKWEADNGTDNNLANGQSSFPTTLYSTYYTEDLFRFTGNYEPEALIENAHYKVIAYFRGNILAYDKRKQLYFPVFVESCVTGCNKSIRFASEEVLKVTYDESGEDTYTVNMDKIIFGK